MKKGINLRIYCSTTAFEKIRRQIVRLIQENTNLEHVENEDQKGQVYSEILRVKDKNSGGQRVAFTINIYRTKSSFLINGPQVRKFIQQVLPGIQSWAQVNKATIDMCNQQLEQMFRKLDVEQIKVLLEEEKTKLTRVAEGKEVKGDFRIKKEKNEKHTQTDGKEYNMNREENNSENDKDDNNKGGSNQINEKKQQLSNSNIVEDRHNAKHELIDRNDVENFQNAKQGLNNSNIVEDSQNAKQELNDRNIVEDNQNDKNRETSQQNLNNITKSTEKIKDEEKSNKKNINGRMERTKVRNNKDTNNISNFEKQEAT